MHTGISMITICIPGSHDTNPSMHTGICEMPVCIQFFLVTNRMHNEIVSIWEIKSCIPICKIMHMGIAVRIWGSPYAYGQGSLTYLHTGILARITKLCAYWEQNIHSDWAIGMLSQGSMDAPLYRYVGQVGPRFGDSGSLEEWKWCHNLMVEVNIPLRPLHTSILDIYKVIESLLWCLKGTWVHPYTISLAKLAPYLGSQGHLRSGHDVILLWLRLISTSNHFIHPW